MKFSQEQLDAIKHRVDYVLSYVVPDNFDRGAIIDSIINDVIDDISDTADWSDYVEDEYNEGDIDIAIARVIRKKIVGEDW